MKLYQKTFKLILYKVHRLLVRGLLKKKMYRYNVRVIYLYNRKV